MPTNSSDALTKELIQNGLKKAISTAEGDAKKRLEQQTADLLAQPNAKLTEVKGKFGDYLKNVQDAYKRAADAKDEMMGLTSTLADKRFKEVNALVDKYNREAVNPPAGLDGVGRLFPKMTPVGPETVKQVDDRRNALKQQFALEDRKEDLDRRKVDLDRQRDKLADEWTKLQEEIKPFDPDNPKVVRLRQQLDDYKTAADKYSTAIGTYQTDVARLSNWIAKAQGNGDASGDGPFRLFIGQYSNTADAKGGGRGEEFQSLKDARAKAESHMSENAAKQPSYRIEDKDGKVVEARGLLRNVKPNQNADTAGASGQPAQPEKKLCYICWYGDMATYGGATQEEALTGGKKASS